MFLHLFPKRRINLDAWVGAYSETLLTQLALNANMDTVTISKAEYDRLKKMAEVDWELVEKFKKSLEDVKHGRVTEWKPE